METKEKTAPSLAAVPKDKVTSDIHTGTKVQNNSENGNGFLKKVGDDIKKNRQKALDKTILPIDGLRDDVQEIIKHFSQSTKSCQNFVAASLLTTIGATAGIGLKVIDGGWHNYGQLYTMLYGSPSDSKTPAIKPVIAPLEAMESDYLELYKQELAKYRELAKDKNADAGVPPICQQLIVQNSTPEAIIDILDKNRRGLLIVADEAYNFFKSIDKYSNGGDFVGELTEIWSNSSLFIDRKGEEIRKVIREPFISYLGGIQPGNLLKIFPKYDGSGFIERWSFCLPNAKPSERIEPDPFIYSRWQYLVRDIRNMNPTNLYFSAESKDFLNEFERKVDEEVQRLSDEGDERMASYVSKQNYMIRRYAAIVHLLGTTYNLQPTTIQLKEVEYSERICSFFKEGTKKVYDDIFEGKDKKEISDAEIIRIIEKRHHITQRQKQSILADIMEKSQQAISKNIKTI